MIVEGYEDRRSGAWRGLVAIGDELGALIAAAEGSGEVLKDDAVTSVQRVGGLIVKRFRGRPGSLSSFLGRGRRGRARRALVNAVALRRAGFSTPRVCAALCLAERPQSSWLVMEEAAGAPLDALPPDIAADLFRSLGRLHKAGVYHGNLKRSNLRLLSGELELLDLDDLRLAPWPRRDRWRSARDLGMLLSSVGGWLTVEERGRVLGQYGESRGLGAAILAELGSKAARLAAARAARGAAPKDGGWDGLGGFGSTNA